MADDWDPFADPADEPAPEVTPAVPDADPAPKTRTRYCKASKAPMKRKVRVLCLHGTCSSSKILQMQLSSLIAACKDDIEFVFVEGTIRVSAEENPELVPMIEKMKKFFGADELFQYALPIAVDPDAPPQEMRRQYQELDPAMEFLKGALEREEPIDAVLGFSQGSNLLNILAAMAGLGHCKPLCCVVHMCSHRHGWTTQKPELFEQQIQVPAMLIHGEKDDVAFDRGELAELYADAISTSHSGDHRPLPSGPEGKKLAQEIIDFIKTNCRPDFYKDVLAGS